MNTITHGLLPLVLAGLYEGSARPKSERRGVFSNWALAGLVFAGALPDLLSPHLTLNARHTSYSHTVFGWVALSVVFLIFLKWRKAFSWALWTCLVFAYGLHLVCDLIAGGIAPLYPVKKDVIVEGYLVSPDLWIPCDILLSVTCYLMFRIIPGYRSRSLAA